MTSPSLAKCLGPGPDPLAVAAGWPPERPLAALISARGDSPLARWSILSTPEASRCLLDGEAATRQGLLETLDELVPTTPSVSKSSDPDSPPFLGGKILILPYELGRALEPKAGHPTRLGQETEPLATVLSCPSALVHDRVRDQWWLVGQETGASELLTCLASATPPNPEPIECESLRATPDDDAYGSMIERTIEYVHAGDIFQANITRRFKAGISLPSPRDRRRFATSLLERSGAWFGAIIETGFEEGGDRRTIISLSPELFLEVDPVQETVRTRPIKGTLPDGSKPEDLRGSEKDAAELAMIVDLMRNDLGRICVPGSVRVSEQRTIEHHPSVLHGVAEVTGRLMKDTSFGNLLESTFPPGSVSGAPKIRAMQVIEELESTSRGIYCGALGFASNCGRMQLDVSIRTLDIRPSEDPGSGFTHELTYGAGGGIVAESTPEGEVAESRVKASLLNGFLDSHRRPASREQTSGAERNAHEAIPG
ncbi:MAG: anthranilate synthase component I family protein [Phycisphaerales bacterium]|nr:anthranilate synthase component I family protein [Phycisphaerales bacterium]